MPVYGPPHGYGLGQLDLLAPNRGVSTQEAFSFMATLETAVELVMRHKAAGAWSQFANSFPAVPAAGAPQAAATLAVRRRMRAVYQREIVRRYNGYMEFMNVGGAWMISPHAANGNQMPQLQNGAPFANLRYPDHVLGTQVNYWTNQGGGPVFAWPIAFQEAHFTPETVGEP
jgi:hypothetical protein